MTIPMLEPGRHLLDSLLDRQRKSWLDGQGATIEALLGESGIEPSNDALLDLVYNEIVVREELGERPTLDDYVQRFPHLREDLELHFEIHHAVHAGVLAEPPHGRNGCHRAALDGIAPELSLQDYELIGELGQGGMGVVYKARHLRLNRHVALKMFRPGRPPTPREVLRFQTEAEAIARLQHPNIVQIFEIGRWEDLPWLALELAEQGTLAQKLQRMPLDPSSAAQLVETLARAMHYAHQQHIIHRDLKPANVLFTRDGTPKITDFGLAKLIEEDGDSPRDATHTGEPLGTPRYMSPEQAAGKQDSITPATDVYALGTLLYECMTGQAPFVATSVVETLDKIRSQEPLPPRRLQPAIPRDLETISLNCLHKEPRRRYASAGALAEDLRRFALGEPILARPTPAWERAWKWCRRRPTHAALTGVGLLLMLAGITFALVHSAMERARLATTRDEVSRLMKEGQNALLRQDADQAQARFQAAWMLVHGEPALQEDQTHVAGWLDHSRRAVSQHRWKQRVPPREYDSLRDEALFLSLLLHPDKQEGLRAARLAIDAALALTLPDDPAWRGEREQLIALDAELYCWEGATERALQRLADAGEPASRLVHERRAHYLDVLDRKAEGDQARKRAEQFPLEKSETLFLQGMDRLRRKDYAEAVRDFEQVLDAEPEHFSARLFQAACYLQQKQPTVAKVALTACIAQRPRFGWSFLLRGQAHLQEGDCAAATQDFERALNLNPGEPLRLALLTHLGLAHLQQHANKPPVPR
jgi:tetratricopeptide (TPR) repeat protein/tRNA A-37 threonylcarbamoyl transferase component Bud32